MKSPGWKEINNVREAAEAFKDHEGISVHSVGQWSQQFGNNHQDLALKILKNINYYSGPSIRVMITKLIDSVRGLPQLNGIGSVIFVPIGSLYEGSGIIARALRDIPGVRAKQIKHLTDLVRFPPSFPIRAIVLLEDFSGSGNRLLDWWKNVEALLLPWTEKSVELILGILVLNHKAKKTMASIPIRKLHVVNLNESHNVFSNKSKMFLKNEKALIEYFCCRTKCSTEYLRGYKGCGLLVAFKHGCPNNSLPVLWHQSRSWKRLFRRRAI